MKLTKQVFASDESYSTNLTCLLSSSCNQCDPSGRPLSLARLSGRNGWTVSLRILWRDWVPLDHALLPPEVVDALGLVCGEQCELEMESDAEIVSSTDKLSVELQFLALKTLGHWDVCADLEDVEYGLHWLPRWPAQASAASLAQSLSLLLCDSLLREGDALIFAYLDTWMAFKVKSTGGSPLIRIGTNCSFQLDFSTEEKTTNEAKQLQLSAHVEKYDFLRPVHSLVQRFSLVTCDALREMGTLAHSYLISAPSGAGKSFLLDGIAAEFANTCGSVVVVRGSCARIDAVRMRRQTALLDSLSLDLGSDRDHTRNRFLQSAAVVLSALSHDLLESCSTEAEMETVLHRTPVLLLLDDLDAVLELFHDQNDVSASQQLFSAGDLDRQADMKTFAYYLGLFLQHLTNESDGLCVWVLGCSRLAASQLPRSCTGSPEFDKVLSLPKPSRSDRALIAEDILCGLSVVLEESGQDSEETERDTRRRWSEQLAELTRGYLPADLVAVLNKAVIMTIGAAPPPAPLSLDGEDRATEVHTLRWRTVLDAIASVPLKTLQTIDFLSSSSAQDLDREYGWQDFAGYEHSLSEIKRMLRPLLSTEAKRKHVNSENSLMRFGVPRGMVLHGPSGCGKSFLAKIIAKELKMNFLRVASSELLSKYFGQTEEKIRKLFQVARSAAPSLLFFDDFDSLAHKRSSASAEGSHGSLQNRVLSTFLNELDGVTANSGQFDQEKKGSLMDSMVFVLVACKDLGNLDEALVRPGRLHFHVLLDYATERDVEQLLRYFMDKMPLGDDIDFETIHTVLCKNSIAKPSGATVESFCSQVRFEALRDAIVSKSEGDARISQKHFDSVLRKMFLRDEDFEETVE